MRNAWVFLTALATGAGALAQDRPGAGEILIDSTGPDAHHERRTVPLPPEGPERDAFMREFLVVDLQENSVRSGTRTLSAREFYDRVGRTDLAAQAEDRTRQRIWLMAGGGAIAAASVAAGIALMSTTKNLNSPSCAMNVTVYNACVDSNKNTTTAGVFILVAGLGLGTGLITWGAFTPEMVTTSGETLRLVADHNLALGRKHGAAGARLQLIPSIAPGYAGLQARLTF